MAHCSFYYSPFGHVYERARLLHWVYVLGRVHMRAYSWDSSWCIFWVRVWVIHSIFVREVSDIFVVSLDPCSIHHPIYFGCDYFPCFDPSCPSLAFPYLCLLLSLFYSSISLYFILCLSFLILLDVWLGFNLHTLFLLLRCVNSFIITFRVGPLGPGLMTFSMHCISCMRGMGIISLGYLCLVSFRFFHLITLAYVTSYVLRPP